MVKALATGSGHSVTIKLVTFLFLNPSVKSVVPILSGQDSTLSSYLHSQTKLYICCEEIEMLHFPGLVLASREMVTFMAIFICLREVMISENTSVNWAEALPHRLPRG